MLSRARLALSYLAGLVVLSACFAKPSAADAPATVSACANPALPAAILPDSDARSAEVPSTGVSPLALREVIAPHPQQPLVLAVAGDERSRELGLMCVLRLKPQHGMIFVFEDDARQEFWMKNTLVPLDMVWVHADGTVDTVAPNVPASTRTTPDAKVARRGGSGKYVIELAAGEAAIDGIVPGAHLKVQTAP